MNTDLASERRPVEEHPALEVGNVAPSRQMDGGAYPSGRDHVSERDVVGIETHRVPHGQPAARSLGRLDHQVGCLQVVSDRLLAKDEKTGSETGLDNGKVLILGSTNEHSLELVCIE